MDQHQIRKEQFKSNWPRFKSELQKNWRDFTDEDLVQIGGDYDRFVAMTQKRCREKEEDVIRWTNDWYSRGEQEEALARQSTISRNQM